MAGGGGFSSGVSVRIAGASSSSISVPRGGGSSWRIAATAAVIIASGTRRAVGP